ncbi:50S ribosomal protein L24 [Ostreibacterium oceani]|uniref:Large ribosomal subunit protein uL24 n=1 Tax=Ostreibacterium oceani TaxID=2654998 RepID=A0A6N7EWG3_9GAMM|nr:50S ribosomal protein L24 [Ostreibacterium oceani]MPV85759.1 50S ribosomal protein L24 [Ostreibacterium oceani]
MNRIKKGDEVIIIAGKNKGNTGTVESVKDDRVVITGQNLVTKHIKGNPMTGETGGLIKKEAAIHTSNVMLVEDGKGVRVGFRDEAGKKVRFSKKSGATI